ncbi:DNA polymerase III subunit beta [Hutsoniella sourekii]
MKFTIKRQPFNNQVANILRAIPSKSTIPVLTGIKLAVNQNELVMIGSDSEISIEAFLPVADPEYQLDIQTTGQVVVAARLFSEIIRKLPEESVTIEVDDQLQVSINSGKANFTLNGMAGDSYPQLPIIQGDNQLELPTNQFKAMINQTIFSASNQESRPILTGLHLTSHANHLEGVATDSHRLSKREIPLAIPENFQTFDSLTIPKKTVTELSRIVEDDQDLQMIISDKQVIFTIENLTIYSRLLEGNYPDTDRLIPSDYSSQIIVNSSEFLAAIERASLISHQGKNNVVQLNIEADQVTLSVRGNERGQAIEVIPSQSVTGEAIRISFNPDYMKEALAAFDGVDVKIELQSPVRPIIIRALEESEVPHNELVQLLTPIRTH